jgi:thymidylate synthase (FAD)
MNAQSGRYTPFEENDFYTPSVWRRQAQSNKQASEGEVKNTDGTTLDALLAEHYTHSFELYQRALAAGVAREQARLFLPGFAIYYTWVTKVDAHNLMHFLSLRMTPDAQWEIQEYARAVYTIFKGILPWTAEAFETYRLSTTE